MAGFELRLLRLDEMNRAALVHRTSFDDRLPWVSGLHTPAEDQRFYQEHVFSTCTVRGVFDDGRLVGLIASRDSWIDQLYVMPFAQRRGFGTALLESARLNAKELFLWTFQRNTIARRFYERHGFVAVQESDGSQNEEHEPDLLYYWTADG